MKQLKQFKQRTKLNLIIHYSSTLTRLFWFILIDVDDLLLRQLSHIHSSCIAALSHWFSIENLSHLHYFLGVEVVSTPEACSSISQQQYIRDILVRFNMKGIKESVTPLSCSTWLTLIDALNRLMPLSNVVWLVACNIFVSHY
jgi:hypothetical protein